MRLSGACHRKRRGVIGEHRRFEVRHIRDAFIFDAWIVSATLAGINRSRTRADEPIATELALRSKL